MSAEKVDIAPAKPEILKGLDWIILIDHSGSTATPSSRKGFEGTRYDEMRESAIAAAQVASKYDDDGITLIHFASNVVVRDGVKADEVANVFREYHPAGNTMLGQALQKAVDKATQTKKEVVVLVYTDGEASDQNYVLQVLSQAGQSLGRPRIGFCFIQVGNDQAAKAFLDRIDNEMKVDICATFSAEDADGLTIEQLVNAARTE